MGNRGPQGHGEARQAVLRDLGDRASPKSAHGSHSPGRDPRDMSRRDREPQNLTRIETDDADVRGFVPCAETAPMAASDLVCFLFTASGSQCVPRLFNKKSWLVALPSWKRVRERSG